MGPEQASTRAEVRRQFHQTGRIGHSASIQTTSRLSRPRRGPDGTHYPKGTAIPIRADFNTLDNPFLYSDEPSVIQAGPMAGIHFLVFNPSSDDFDRNRLAMDGMLPGGTCSPAARSRAGLQLDPQHDAPPELPRAAAPAPQLPLRRSAERRCAPARKSTLAWRLPAPRRHAGQACSPSYLPRSTGTGGIADFSAGQAQRGAVSRAFRRRGGRLFPQLVPAAEDLQGAQEDVQDVEEDRRGEQGRSPDVLRLPEPLEVDHREAGEDDEPRIA